MAEPKSIQTALDEAQAAYKKVQDAYDIWYRHEYIDADTAACKRLDYRAAVDEYRELCTVIVERLIKENPKVLEDMHVLYLS